MHIRLSLIAVFGLLLSVISSAQSQVTKETVPGITNFARVETTVACAGATTPAAVAEVKRLGFKSVVNLRPASEAGADIEGEEAAALRLTSSAFKTFALDQIQARAKPAR